MELTLPPGTITWEARQSYSTINLVFLSSRLVPLLEHCKTRPEIGQSSDHIPVSTKLLLPYEATPVQPPRAWKMMDMDMLKKKLKQENLARILLNHGLDMLNHELDNVATDSHHLNQASHLTYQVRPCHQGAPPLNILANLHYWIRSTKKEISSMVLATISSSKSTFTMTSAGELDCLRPHIYKVPRPCYLAKLSPITTQIKAPLLHGKNFA